MLRLVIYNRSRRSTSARRKCGCVVVTHHGCTKKGVCGDKDRDKKTIEGGAKPEGSTDTRLGGHPGEDLRSCRGRPGVRNVLWSVGPTLHERADWLDRTLEVSELCRGAVGVTMR